MEVSSTKVRKHIIRVLKQWCLWHTHRKMREGGVGRRFCCFHSIQYSKQCVGRNTPLLLLLLLSQNNVVIFVVKIVVKNKLIGKTFNLLLCNLNNKENVSILYDIIIVL